MYEVKFTDYALDGVNKLMKSEPAAYNKLLKLSQEFKTLEKYPFRTQSDISTRQIHLNWQTRRSAPTHCFVGFGINGRDDIEM